MIGIDILNPKTVVVISILLTSIRIRGRNLDEKRERDMVSFDQRGFLDQKKTID